MSFIDIHHGVRGLDVLSLDQIADRGTGRYGSCADKIAVLVVDQMNVAHAAQHFDCLDASLAYMGADALKEFIGAGEIAALQFELDPERPRDRVRYLLQA